MVGKLTWQSAQTKILNQYPDSKILAVMPLKNGYLFSIQPKSYKNNEYALDAYFRVDYSGKISEYSPVMDPAEFKKAMANRIR